MGLIRLNIKIIHTINSCNREEFKDLLDEVIATPNIFRSRKYVWNIIRPRDFYKCCSYWIIKQCNAITQMEDPDERQNHIDLIELVIHEIIDTTPNFKIRQSFVWNIMKQFPILTSDTIQYASAEKVRNVLSSDKPFLADQSLHPFIMEINELRQENEILRTSIEL